MFALFCAEEITAHSSNVSSVVLGKSSSRLLVTGGDDCRVNIWSVNKPNCIMVRKGLFSASGGRECESWAVESGEGGEALSGRSLLDSWVEILNTKPGDRVLGEERGSVRSLVRPEQIREGGLVPLGQRLLTSWILCLPLLGYRQLNAGFCLRSAGFTEGPVSQPGVCPRNRTHPQQDVFPPVPQP